MNFLYFLLIGLLAGWLAGLIMKNRGFGVAGNLIIGCVGAALGGFLFGMLGLKSYSLLGSLITATVGAVVLVWLIGVVGKTRRA